MQGATYRTTRTAVAAVSLISLLLLVGSLLPVSARAGLLSDVLSSMKGADAQTQRGAVGNLQTMPLLRAAMNITPTPSRGGGDVMIVDGSALVPEEGPSGTIADIEKSKNSTISLYVVREGDTLSEIAEMFDVSVNTIRWANDISSRGTIQPGQTLTILPVTGVKYTVKKGDTLSSIAKNLHGDADEIARFNGLAEGSALAVGTGLIIPDGEIAVAVATPAPRPSSTSSSGGSAQTYAGYYMRPIAGGIRTQGIHGYNGVDLAAPLHSAIMASAGGEVIVARDSGWNGGYGNYVVIKHDNGTQTLYAHNSSNIVSVGQRVVQGQIIAYVGTTGRSTGPHVHFEIRGGPRNPF